MDGKHGEHVVVAHVDVEDVEDVVDVEDVEEDLGTADVLVLLSVAKTFHDLTDSASRFERGEASCVLEL